MPAIAGEGVALRAPQMSDCARMGGIARSEPRLPHAVGADLACRRSHPRVLSPPHQALFRGPAQRPRLCVLRVPQARRCAARRSYACQYSPRLRAGRKPRLLDGRGLCAPGLHDGGGERHHPVRVRDVEAAPDRGRLHPGQCRIGPAAGEDRLQARGLCPPISLHRRGLAGPSARTRGSRTIRRPALGASTSRSSSSALGPPSVALDKALEAGNLSRNPSIFNASGA